MVMRKGFDAGAHLFRLLTTPIKPAAHVHPPYLQRYVESMCTSQVVLLTGAHQARPLHAQRTRTAQPIESKRARPPLLNNTPIKPAAHVHPPYAPSLSTLLCANPHTPPTIGLGCPPRGAIPAGEGGWRGTPSTGRGGGAPRAAKHMSSFLKSPWVRYPYIGRAEILTLTESLRPEDPRVRVSRTLTS